MKTAEVFPLIFSIALAGYAQQPWKAKPLAEWTEDDARQVLSDSPWSRPVTPKFDQSGGPGGYGGRRGAMGGGIGGGIGGIGMGGPRRGMGGGMGAPGSRRGDPDMGGGREPGGRTDTPPTVTVRWESALPVRQAQLKLGQESVDTDEPYYAVAVLGLPARMANRDPEGLKGRLQSEASLKPKGKKAIAPADVKLLTRDDNPILLLLFPKTAEITPADKEVEFSARIGHLVIKQKFAPKDMTYDGKLEL